MSFAFQSHFLQNPQDLAATFKNYSNEEFLKNLTHFIENKDIYISLPQEEYLYHFLIHLVRKRPQSFNDIFEKFNCFSLSLTGTILSYAYLLNEDNFLKISQIAQDNNIPFLFLQRDLINNIKTAKESLKNEHIVSNEKILEHNKSLLIKTFDFDRNIDPKILGFIFLLNDQSISSEFYKAFSHFDIKQALQYFQSLNEKEIFRYDSLYPFSYNDIRSDPNIFLKFKENLFIEVEKHILNKNIINSHENEPKNKKIFKI